MSTTIATTQIWLLEDHAIFAKQMRRLIAGEPDLDCTHHFSSPDELFEKLRFTNERPDVLLLDLGLPRRDGLEVLCDLRKALPNIKVLILSAFDDRERVYRAICNGASGYLLKTADPDEILQGIRDVIHGAAALSSSIATMILQGFAKHGPVEQVETLTTREEEVLRALVKGYIKKEIADQLEISQHTVDMHLRSVYRKLHVRSQTEAVSKALRQGLV
jgi:DNA-binding NarL/FixJ family response regulator